MRTLIFVGVLLMRLPLVGPAEALSSPLAAAASECSNAYPEVIETPEDQQKNRAILRKRPGAHLVYNLGLGGVRGLFACESPNGGGRLFVVASNTLYEIGINTYVPGNPSTGAGSIISSHVLPVTGGIANSNPAQMFGNGNQLGIVANGRFYYDNGAGPIEARFMLAGSATAAGSTFTRTGGDAFTAEMVGRTITVNGENLTVSGYTSADQITLSGAPGGGKSGSGAMVYGGVFFNFSAGTNPFSPDMVGKSIVINGATYTIAEYASPGAIRVNDANAPQGTGQAWSTVLTNMTWECDGGDLVTATTGAYLAGAAWVSRPIGGTPDLGRQVNFSDPFDFRTWRGLSFKQKESAPDYVHAIHADRGILHILGTESSEDWQLNATTGLPERIPGTEMREGLALRWTPTAFAQSLFFIGGSPNGALVAYRRKGFVPVPISTAAVEQEWANAGVFAGLATAYGYINNTGHMLWVVNFVTPAMSWAYDITASDQLGYPVWHRLTAWDGAAESQYPYWYHAYVKQWGSNGLHIVGGPGNGKIYDQSDLYGDDDGADIRIRRAIPYRYNGGRRIFFGRQDLQAVGGSFLRDYSDDNGATWSTAQQEIGNGTTRRFWPTGGSCNSPGRIWRLTSTDKTVVTLIDLQGDESPGVV